MYKLNVGFEVDNKSSSKCNLTKLLKYRLVSKDTGVTFSECGKLGRDLEENKIMDQVIEKESESYKEAYFNISDEYMGDKTLYLFFGEKAYRFDFGVTEQDILIYVNEN